MVYCHNAIFVITGGAQQYIVMTTSDATSDDKIGIMITLSFQWL